jgi:hypothetical protein
MKHILLAIMFAVLTVAAQAQQFPATMPPSTVYGRLPPNAGPGQAIPFSTLGPLLPGGSGGGTGACDMPTTTSVKGVPSVNICAFGAAAGAAPATNRIAIQAAIDYAFANNLRSIYCPSGTYRYDLPLFLDPPASLRGIGSSSAWNSGTTYALNAVVLFNGIPWISLQNANVGNTPFIGVGVPNSSTFWLPTTVSPSVFNWSPTFWGDPGIGNNNSFGCTLQPVFNGVPAFYMGSNNGQQLTNVSICGSDCNFGTGTFYGQLPPGSSGVCITGGPAGANRTVVQNVLLSIFYTGIITGCNQDALGAENVFDNVTSFSCVRGIVISQSQNDINKITGPSLSCRDNIISAAGPGVSVFGGNLSFSGAPAATLGISSTSALTGGTGDGSDITFTTTVALDGLSTDCQFNNNRADCIYNAWMIQTPHYGMVPLRMTNWVWPGSWTGSLVSGTATFQILPGWTQNYIGFGTIANTTLQADIQAATTVDAAMQATTFTGSEVSASDFHIENNGTCTTLLADVSGFNGGKGVTFTDVRFNYGIGQVPGNGQYSCQQSFPFIRFAGGGGNFHWDNSNPTQDVPPIILDFEDSTLMFKMTTNLGMTAAQNFINPNLRVSGRSAGWQSAGGGHFGGPFAQTPGMGAGLWDASPWRASGWNLGTNARSFLENTVFAGYRPHSGTTPRMFGSLYNVLQPSSATVTMPLASPGVVNWTANGLANGSPVSCTSTMALPPAVTSGTTYYAVSVATNTIELALHPGGTAVNFSSAGTGTITCTAPVRDALGNYPGINGMTNYSVLDWNIPVGTGGGLPFNAGRFVSSAHYFDSYGVNLTTGNVPTLGWTYQGGSWVVLLDQGSLKWVYPGLGITLNNGGGPTQYIITGVWPLMFLDVATATVTFNIGTNTVNWTANGLQNGMTIRFSGGTLPTGVSPNTDYYVSNQMVNSVQLTDINGTLIAMSGSSSGTITGQSYHPGFITVLNASHGEQCQFSTCWGEGTTGTKYTGSTIGQGAYSWSNH